MTVFTCNSCGAPLTPELTRQDGPLVRPSYDYRGPGPSSVAAGFYAIDPEPFGAPFVSTGDDDDMRPMRPGVYSGSPDDSGWLVPDGPRDSIVIHPDDARGLKVHADGMKGGCCGPPGDAGKNLECGCGQAVATLMAECYGAHELHLDPTSVQASAQGW